MTRGDRVAPRPALIVGSVAVLTLLGAALAAPLATATGPAGLESSNAPLAGGMAVEDDGPAGPLAAANATASGGSREKVTDTRRFPYSAVVRVSSSLGTGSGFFVTDRHVVTAAHVVTNDRGEVAGSDYSVAPGRTVLNGSAYRPYGEYDVAEVRTHPDWDGNALRDGDDRPSNYADDFAVLTLDRPVGAVTGSFSVEGHSTDDDVYVQNVSAIGYPQDRGGDEMWEAVGGAGHSNWDELQSVDAPLAKGNSGGPVIGSDDGVDRPLSVASFSGFTAEHATKITPNENEWLENRTATDPALTPRPNLVLTEYLPRNRRSNTGGVTTYVGDDGNVSQTTAIGVEAYVYNNGTASVDSFDVAFYLTDDFEGIGVGDDSFSFDRSEATLLCRDTVRTGTESPLPGVDPFTTAKASCSGNGVVPSLEPEGYNVYAVVDPDDEVSEHTPASTRPYNVGDFTVERTRLSNDVDVEIEDVEAPPLVPTNDDLRVTATVRNDGESEASTAFGADFGRLSCDQSYAPTTIPAGETTTVSFDCSVGSVIGDAEVSVFRLGYPGQSAPERVERTVTVSDEYDGYVWLRDLETPDSVARGETLRTTVGVAGVGDTTTRTVRLDVGGTNCADESVVTVERGARTDLSLSCSLADVDAEPGDRLDVAVSVAGQDATRTGTVPLRDGAPYLTLRNETFETGSSLGEDWVTPTDGGATVSVGDGGLELATEGCAVANATTRLGPRDGTFVFEFEYASDRTTRSPAVPAWRVAANGSVLESGSIPVSGQGGGTERGMVRRRVEVDADSGSIQFLLGSQGDCAGDAGESSLTIERLTVERIGLNDSIQSGDPAVGVNDDVVFDANPAYGTDVEVREWSFGDGTVVPTDHSSFSHAYREPGTYEVNATVVDADGDLRVARGSIRVYPRIGSYPARNTTLDANGTAAFAVPVRRPLSVPGFGDRPDSTRPGYTDAGGVRVRTEWTEGRSVETVLRDPSGEQATVRREQDGNRLDHRSHSDPEPGGWTFVVDNPNPRPTDVSVRSNYPLIALPGSIEFDEVDAGAGPPDAPRPITADVRVANGETPYHPSNGTVDPSQFAVSVDDDSIRGDPVVTRRSAGAYRLRFTPPEKPSVGEYDLSVSFEDGRAGANRTVTATRGDAVSYAEPGPVAVSLAVDRVQTTSGDRIENNRQAARTALSFADDGDSVGVVTNGEGDDDRRVVHDLAPVESDRESIRSSIDGIEEGGWMNVGVRLTAARDQLDRAPNETRTATVLLGDGLLNVGPFQDEIANRIVESYDERGHCLYTVSVGDHAADAFLQRIAERADCGFYVDDPDRESLRAVLDHARGESGREVTVDDASGSLAPGAETRRSVSLSGDRDAVLRVATGSGPATTATPASGSTSTATSTTTSTATTTAAATSTASATALEPSQSAAAGPLPSLVGVAAAQQADGTTVALYAPNGSRVDPPTDADVTRSVADERVTYRIENPESGTWEYAVVNDGAESVSYSATAAVRTRTSLDAGVDARFYETGSTATLSATYIGPDGPVTGASVEGVVTGPDGSERTVSLDERSPGTYATEVALPETGDYEAQVRAESEGPTREVQDAWRVYDDVGPSVSTTGGTAVAGGRAAVDVTVGPGETDGTDVTLSAGRLAAANGSGTIDAGRVALDRRSVSTGARNVSIGATVAVPEGTAPGRYVGTVRARTPGGTTTTAPVSVTVERPSRAYLRDRIRDASADWSGAGTEVGPALERAIGDYGSRLALRDAAGVGNASVAIAGDGPPRSVEVERGGATELAVRVDATGAEGPVLASVLVPTAAGYGVEDVRADGNGTATAVRSVTVAGQRYERADVVVRDPAAVNGTVPVTVRVGVGDSAGAATVRSTAVDGPRGATAPLHRTRLDPGADDGPGPIGDDEASPTDPDDDGRYEDVNGDGSTNLADAGDLFQHRDAAAVTDHVQEFDFSGNGEVDLADVVDLFQENAA